MEKFQIAPKPSKMAPNDSKTLKKMLKHVFEPFGMVLDGFGLILAISKIRIFRRALSAGGRGDFNAIWGNFGWFWAKIAQRPPQMTQNDEKTLKSMKKHVFEPFGVVLDGFWAI